MRSTELACRRGRAVGRSTADQDGVGVGVERAPVDDLDQMIAGLDLTPWLFTRDVIIEEGTIPHSHPILTLGTRNGGWFQLSSLLHEQIHWHLEDHDAAVQLLIDDELRPHYPRVPVGRPEGARDELSTYQHLVVCWLECEAMHRLAGPDHAERVMQGFIRGGLYTWVYRTVLTDSAPLQTLIEQAGLRL